MGPHAFDLSIESFDPLLQQTVLTVLKHLGTVLNPRGMEHCTLLADAATTIGFVQQPPGQSCSPDHRSGHQGGQGA